MVALAAYNSPFPEMRCGPALGWSESEITTCEFATTPEGALASLTGISQVDG